LNWGALALIITGVVLLVAEMYITSYGLLGIAGLISFIAGSLFLFHGEGGFISVDYPVLISTLLGVGCSSGILIWYLLKDKARQKPVPDFFLPVGSGGTVMSVTGFRTYQIKVKGEIWNGSSDNDLALGEAVEVISVQPDQLSLSVKKVSKE
jgi:membrane-bound serine protease (ClpP class)